MLSGCAGSSLHPLEGLVHSQCFLMLPNHLCPEIQPISLGGWKSLTWTSAPALRPTTFGISAMAISPPSHQPLASIHPAQNPFLPHLTIVAPAVPLHAPLRRFHPAPRSYLCTSGPVPLTLPHRLSRINRYVHFNPIAFLVLNLLKEFLWPSV